MHPTTRPSATPARRATATAAGAGLAALALLLAGCGGGEPAATAPSSASEAGQSEIDAALTTPTTLTFWTWVDGLDTQVAAFEEKYPAITIDLVNAGQGKDQYTKLSAALQAGKDVPDMAQVEYNQLPFFRVTDALADLTPYGADELASQFTAGSWGAVSSGDGVYGVPQDGAPMFVMYRADVLAKAGIDAPPATWADFVADAATVKTATGGTLMNLGPGDADQMVGFLQQAGATPFSYDGGTEIGINLQTPEVKQVADTFTQLVQSGAVSTDASWTNEWFAAFDQGTYASWPVGAWGPGNLTGTATKSAGDWEAALLPQWQAGTTAGAAWGGSADVVLKGSENPIAAYEFLKYVNADPTSAAALNTNPKSALFPVTTAVLDSAEFTDQKSDYFGGQQVNQVLAEAADSVHPGFTYPPFWNYAKQSYGETVGAAVSAKGDLYTAMGEWQADLVEYAQQQGFTVS